MNIDDDFYNSYQEKDDKSNIKKVSKNNDRKSKYIIIFIILLVVLGVLVYFLLKMFTNHSDNQEYALTLSSVQMELNKGEEQQLQVGVNTTEAVEINWSSSDTKVVTVDENGNVSAIGSGTATITASYVDNNGEVMSASCKVTVNDVKDEYIPTMTYTVSNNVESNWSNENVKITFNLSNTDKLKSFQYALNCTNDCTYNDIKNNTLSISEEGNNIISLVAVYDNEQKINKSISVKIDKTKPICNVNSTKITDNGVIYSLKGVDSLSGIKSIAGKTYNSSGADYSVTINTGTLTKIVVLDNAGNATTCPDFTTVACYKYDYSESCKKCSAAGVSGEYSLKYTYEYFEVGQIPVLTTKKTALSNKMTKYYESCNDTSDGRYQCKVGNITYSYNKSCSKCGYDGGLTVLFTDKNSLVSTDTLYYKFYNSKTCINSCSSTNCTNN